MNTIRYSVLQSADRPESELVVKRSRFLGFAHRVATEQEARDFLAELRRAHREARHVCHAFVLGPQRATQRCSDDGEPAGTAGAPILKAITARVSGTGLADLSDVVVAVVRYFGGTKLGTGGLTQAYSEAASQTLGRAIVIRRQRMRLLAIPSGPGEAGRLESVLRAAGVDVLATDYLAEQAILRIAVADESAAIGAITHRIANLTGGRSTLEPTGTQWLDLG